MYNADRLLSKQSQMAKQWNPWHPELKHLLSSSADPSLRVIPKSKKEERNWRSKPIVSKTAVQA